MQCLSFFIPIALSFSTYLVWCSERLYIEPLPAIAISLALLPAFPLCCLSFLEHKYSKKPSNIIVLYLLTTAICELIWFTAPRPFENPFPNRLTSLILFQAILKLPLLILESMGKESITYKDYREDSPEETAGVLRIAFLWWLNPILFSGSRKMLQENDLPYIHSNLASRQLRRDVLAHWDRRSK
jgi:ATP-binding cassette, subfamily C (CFTR/MRP), member 1